MKSKKRQKLGEGYIWFVSEGSGGYLSITLYNGKNGHGKKIAIDPKGLGAWQKVKLYAEYVPMKRGR